MPALIFCCLNMNKLYTIPAWGRRVVPQNINSLFTITSYSAEFTKSLQFAHQMDLIVWYNSRVGRLCPNEGATPRAK